MKLFYRGQYKGSYDLISGVFRKDDIGNSNADKEDYYWHEAHVRCPEFFEHSTHLDNLVTMQHFGFPTRLLDITSNPLVALFFSCKNYGCSRCNTADTGKVFFAVIANELLYADSDKARIISCLPRLSRPEKEEILNMAMTV